MLFPRRSAWVGRSRPDQLDAQLTKSDKLFSEIFGQKTFLFRPPWGSHAPALDQRRAARSDTLVLWNLGMAGLGRASAATAR